MTFVNMYIFVGGVQLYIISKFNIKDMKKSNLIVFLSLMLLVLPILKLQAEDSGLRSDSSVKVESTDDKYPLPPVPLPKPGTGTSVDVKNHIELGDDKGGLREHSGQSTDDSKMSEEQKNKMKIEIEARKKDMLSKLNSLKEERKMKLEAKAQEKVKKSLMKIFKNLNNQIDRLSKVDVKIGERIKALKESGADTSAQEAQYAKAQTALAKAKVDVEAANSTSTDQVNGTTSKETLRSLVKTAEESIKIAGKEYMKIIPTLPEVKVKTEVDAKSSTSTSTVQ